MRCGEGGWGDDPDGGSVKFGAYSTETDDMVHARQPFAGRVADWQQTAEASVMDTADDIAYAIHDLEDVHRVGVLQQGAVAAELMAWQRTGPRTADGRPAARLRAVGEPSRPCCSSSQIIVAPPPDSERVSGSFFLRVSFSTEPSRAAMARARVLASGISIRQ